MNKRKFANKTPYPDYVIERLTRCIYEDVIAFYATEEGRQEYARWEAEQKVKKEGGKKRGRKMKKAGQNFPLLFQKKYTILLKHLPV